MSDNDGDLELSYSSYEFEENESESENGIRPFLYEPEASDTGTDADISSENSDEDQSRIGNTDW